MSRAVGGGEDAKRVRGQLCGDVVGRKVLTARGINEQRNGTIFTADATRVVAVALQPQLLVDDIGVFWERAFQLAIFAAMARV